MTVENKIRAFAGSFVLISLTLGYFYSPYWFLFTAFVGLNLLQSAFTHFCPLEIGLRRIEARPRSTGRASDVAARPDVNRVLPEK